MSNIVKTKKSLTNYIFEQDYDISLIEKKKKKVLQYISWITQSLNGPSKNITI